MDDARARSTRAAVIHSSDRAVGRAVRARAFSVSMREGGVCRVVIGRWNATRVGVRTHP